MPFEKIDNVISAKNLISSNSQTTGDLLNSNQASSLDPSNISSSSLGHSSYSSDLLYTSTNTSQNHKDEFSVGYSQWSQPGGKGTSVDITYSYSNLLDGGLKGGLLATKIRSIVEEALKLWSKYTPLNFKEVKDSGPAPSDNSYSDNNNPQIRFGHHYIDGNAGVLAHAYYPGSGLGGDVHFDNGDSWSDNPSTNFDLLEVAVHEIGHALGLRHESSNEAVMNPSYGRRFKGAGTAFLLQDDINGIRDIYGSGIGSVTPLGNTSPGYQYYTFTYTYGNGDSYTGYGYAESGKYSTNQYIYDTLTNETSYKGNYQINSATNYTGATVSYLNQVYVNSYYDGDSSKKYYTPASGSGTSGLGSESGYLVSNNFDTYFGGKYYEADIKPPSGYQYYTFTYSYGNGDSYTGYGYAESGKYSTNQYIYDTLTNETGYKGNYQINSATNYTGATVSYLNQVYVNSYYDGDSSKKYYTPASGSGTSGLGSESGYLVSNNFDTYFGGKYYEADIKPPSGYQYYTFTYSYGNGDSYTGYGYAESNKYTTNQYIYDTSSNETGYKGNYQINSVTNYTGATVPYLNQVYVNSYYDGDSSKRYYTPASGSGSSGLGSEYGYLVSTNFNTYFGSKYYEADIL